jgi:quinol monooxygenase YgiN
MLGPLRAAAGCLSCHLYADLEDSDVLLLAQEWVGGEELREHLRADNARVLLSALDYALDPPEVRLDRLTGSQGIEFIARCLDAGDRPDA